MDDHTLVESLAAGDKTAFATLVEKYEKPLMNFILRFVGDRHSAEDIFQETFVRLMRSVAEYTPQGSFSTWLFTIARNLSLDHLRSRRRRREVSLAPPSSPTQDNVLQFQGMPEDEGIAPEQMTQKDETRGHVLRALRQLSDVKREVLSLRYFSDLPFEEIARIQRAPVGTVKFRAHHALKELAETLRQYMGGTPHGLQEIF